jgi:hypothetical protein
MTSVNKALARDEQIEDGRLRKVTAIVRSEVLEQVEKRLQDLRLPGISVTRVKGFGEYANFFSRDWMAEHTRVEIFLRRKRAHEVARATVDVAGSRATAWWWSCPSRPSTAFVRESWLARTGSEAASACRVARTPSPRGIAPARDAVVLG